MKTSFNHWTCPQTGHGTLIAAYYSRSVIQRYPRVGSRSGLHTTPDARPTNEAIRLRSGSTMSNKPTQRQMKNGRLAIRSMHTSSLADSIPDVNQSGEMISHMTTGAKAQLTISGVAAPARSTGIAVSTPIDKAYIPYALRLLDRRLAEQLASSPLRSQPRVVVTSCPGLRRPPRPKQRRSTSRQERATRLPLLLASYLRQLRDPNPAITSATAVLTQHNEGAYGPPIPSRPLLAYLAVSVVPRPVRPP
jgi:hypothetical protein